ncbi:tyrosine-type recombinase/integrase [Sinorhizobium medicae]|nr:tyrosine-type recombinase/integrase [Sinorhizobium medicae]
MYRQKTTSSRKLGRLWNTPTMAGWGTGETLAKTMSVFPKVLKEYVDRRMQEVFEPEVLAGITGQSVPTATAPANMSKISTFIGKWQKDISEGYSGGKKLGDETTDQYRQSVELFIGLMGDRPVGKITFDLAAEFREKILELPASHGKGRTGSIKKELALAKANTEAPRLTMKTAKRHFSGMNSIWKWLIAKKHVPAQFNPFAGHSFPGTKSTKSARDAWSSEDLERLFSSSAYRQAPTDSAMHWLPLISLFSGLRLEEICRLRPDQDLILRDRVYCFDIKKRLGWDPKTEAGSRVVPVHSWLLSNGFREFVDRQQAARSEHLFPELQLHKNKLSSGFSRDFSRMKAEIGVGKKTAFHSFRHTFRTVLGSTDHKDSHIDAVMGHEGGGGEGRVYDKGVTTAKLKEVVQSFSISVPFEIEGAGPHQHELISTNARREPKIKKRKLTPPVLDENGRLVRSKRS